MLVAACIQRPVDSAGKSGSVALMFLKTLQAPESRLENASFLFKSSSLCSTRLGLSCQTCEILVPEITHHFGSEKPSEVFDEAVFHGKDA